MFNKSTPGVLVAVLVSAIIGTGLLAAPAHARADKLAMAGVGGASVPTEGAATFQGDLSGTPLSGVFTGRLDAADGSLPGPGTCESGTARLFVQDGRGRFVELLTESGQVCSTLLPLGSVQAFDGRFNVVSTSEHRLRRVGGALQVRLLGDLSDVYAIGG